MWVFLGFCHHYHCLNGAGWLLSWKLWVLSVVISASHKCVQPAFPSAVLVIPSRTHWGTLSLQAQTTALELPPNRTLYDRMQMPSSDHRSHSEKGISIAEWSWVFWFTVFTKDPELSRNRTQLQWPGELSTPKLISQYSLYDARVHLGSGNNMSELKSIHRWL